MLYSVDVKNNEYIYVRYAIEELLKILNYKSSIKPFYPQHEAGNYAFKKLMDVARCLIHNEGFKPSGWGEYTGIKATRDGNNYDTVVVDGIKEYYVIKGEVIRIVGADFARSRRLCNAK